MSAVYGDAHEPATTGGVVREVGPGSAGAAAGLCRGDVIVRVDGQRLRDVIDWMWLTADTPVSLTVRRARALHEVELRREPGQALGVGFTHVLFDGVRTCDNACLFCFVAQLPHGLRPSLYVRDDDFRLSFLDGNFVSLTNLTNADVARIRQQRLSPLHVSVHAVDPDVRAPLVCATAEDLTLRRVDELLAEDIELRVQIVLVPDVNDGEVLDRTLEWLAARAGVTSVGVVPLGYTASQARFSRSFEEPEAAAVVLDALGLWRDAMARERGARWVYAADELYLAAGRELPGWDAYDGFPQFENGIGMTRAFIDEFGQSVVEADGRPQPGAPARPLTLVTGTLFAPVLQRLAPRLADLGVEPRVLPVRNAFLGGNVAVAGLLTGADLTTAIRDDLGGSVYLVPDVVVNSDGLLLDDVAGAELPALTGKDVHIVSSDAAGLVAAVERLGAGIGG